MKSYLDYFFGLTDLGGLWIYILNLFIFCILIYLLLFYFLKLYAVITNLIICITGWNINNIYKYILEIHYI